MEDTTYSNLGARKPVNPIPQSVGQTLDEDFGLSTLIDEYSRSGWDHFEEQKLLKALSFEFKALLEIEELREMVQDLVQIDHHLHLVMDHISREARTVGLESFYQNLSTLFIRMALEEEVNADSMKRAIEIALEEEIYTWQERLQ